MKIPAWIKNFQWNWGWALLLVFITFMSVFLYLFYLSFKELETNEMVTEDYIADEMKFNDKLKKIHRADTMRIPVKTLLRKKGILMVFPPYYGEITGMVNLYKPDKKLLDKTWAFTLDSTRVLVIPADSLIYGRWNVQLQWKKDGKEYMREEKIFWNR